MGKHKSIYDDTGFEDPYQKPETRSKHQDDEALLSSPRDFEAFIEDSPIWADIEQTINDRIDFLTEDLVIARDADMILQIQSEIKVWKEARALPYYLLNHAKIEHKIKEQEDARDKN